MDDGTAANKVALTVHRPVEHLELRSVAELVVKSVETKAVVSAERSAVMWVDWWESLRVDY